MVHEPTLENYISRGKITISNPVFNCFDHLDSSNTVDIQIISCGMHCVLTTLGTQIEI